MALLGNKSGRNSPLDWLQPFVFDAQLRQTKQRAYAPVVDLMVALPPIGLTVGGLLLGLAAAVAAADSRWMLALALFVANRAVDGLDGEVARARGEASDEGGYVDMVVDTVVYAAIPLGAAAGSNIDHIWPLAAGLVASFYINTTTWAYLSALFEKRGRLAADAAAPPHEAGTHGTSIVMPPGLVEGAETVVFFAVMLALPELLDWTMGIMATAVALGAAVRFRSGCRQLRTFDEPDAPSQRLESARQAVSREAFDE